MDFFARRKLYRDALLSFIRAESDLYLLTDMPGNIGDHLICAGTRELLVSGNIRFKCIPVGKVANTARKSSTLLIPGSGAFDQRWHEWLPDTVLAASNNFRRVIILPSSYDVSVPIVVKSLSQRNVFPFAREVKSYLSIKHLNHAALCFDCATFFNFNEAGTTDLRVDEAKAPLLVLREDAGSLLGTQGYAPNPVINQDISLTTSCLDDWIAKIRNVTTVVTDRLHVGVAAVLLGKQLVYIDPYGEKLSTYFKYTFRESFKDRITRCSLSWLMENKYILPVKENA